jgi:hypothetical protein
MYDFILQGRIARRAKDENMGFVFCEGKLQLYYDKII